MKILVTGGAGYIGGITAKHLLDAGHEVVVFDSLQLGHVEADDPRARRLGGDIRHESDIRSALQAVRPDAVMHFAAYALVGESSADPGKYYRNNDLGGINLINAMQAVGCKRIVFSSTCATYGQPDHMPITEETPQRPTNPYGHSKLMFEQMLTWFQRIHSFQPVFLRYFNACGAEGDLGEDREIETHIIPNILRVPLGRKDHVDIFGDDYRTPDGTCIRDYIHVTDLARAHLLAVESDVTGPVNLGTGRGFSVKEIVDAARAVTGHPIPAVIGPRRAGDPDELIADPTKAERVLGWKARYTDPAEIIASAWAWHKAHPYGYAH